MFKAIIFDFSWTLHDKEKGELFEGVPELLEYLKGRGYPLGLYSRESPGEEREKQIKELGLRKYFRIVKVTREKTATDILEMAGKLGATPEEVLVVGDRADREIGMAQQMGMKTIWLRKGKYSGILPKKRPDYVMHEISELKSLF